MLRTRVISHTQGQGCNMVKVKSCLKYVSAITKKLVKQILMKLYRKIKSNEKVCHIQALGCDAQGQGHCQGLKVKMLCNYFKTALVNISKLHRKIKHNEEISHI